METLIKERQQEYYKVLGECDIRGDSGAFIEFILQGMAKTEQVSEQETEQETEQVKKILEAVGDEVLSTKELMVRLGLKHRPTFRDNYLLPAIARGCVEMTIPEKPNRSKQRYRKVKKK